MKSDYIMNRVNYVQDLNTSYMAYELMQQDEGSDYQVKMIQHNQISGFVPMTYYAIDHHRAFRYNLTGLVSMDLYLSRKEPEPKELAQFLLQIMDTLLNAESYMLEYSHFLLEVNHTYIDLSTMRVYLIYLPIIDEDKEPFEAVNHYLQDVLYAYKGDVSSSLSVMINQLNARLRLSYQSLSALRKVLIDILNVSDEKPIQNEERSIVENQQNSYPISAGINKLPINSLMRKSSKRSNKNQLKSVHINGSYVAIIVIDFALICAGFILQKSIIAVTGSVMNSLLGAVCIGIPLNYFLFKYMMNKGLNKPASVPVYQAPKTPKQSNKENTFNRVIGKTIDKVELQDHQLNTFSSKRYIPSPVMDENEQKSYGVAPDKIQPKTELLGERRTKQAYLKDRDSEDCILIQKQRFIIGRQGDLVDLVINESTVGRIHAEIQHEKDDYFISDLNSKNGTRVNNERINSNTPIELKEGDCIVFSTKAFYFKKGKN